MTNNLLIVKKTLSDEVSSKLREQIIAGVYRPGDRLPIEPELMKLFGVGRSTIREAIRALSNSGILSVQQGVGTFVASVVGKESVAQRLKRARAQDVDEVRQLMEVRIAEKAALNRSRADLTEMSKYLSARKKAAESNRLTECIDADVAFHASIAAACKNEILADLYKSVSSHLKEWFQTMYVDTDRFVETQGLHKRLYEAIEAKEPEKARKLAQQIITH
jgi:DNA-binding FadR family transcriptional regulator